MLHSEIKGFNLWVLVGYNLNHNSGYGSERCFTLCSILCFSMSYTPLSHRVLSLCSWLFRSGRLLLLIIWCKACLGGRCVSLFCCSCHSFKQVLCDWHSRVRHLWILAPSLMADKLSYIWCRVYTAGVFLTPPPMASKLSLVSEKNLGCEWISCFCSSCNSFFVLSI